jgi:thiamine biosynthesis protein ThiI
VREYCAISTGRPATAASAQAVLHEERGLDDSVLGESLASAKLFDLRGMDMARVAGESVFLNEIPEGAVVLDTRAPESFRDWHWRGALHREYLDLVSDFETLSRDSTYVLYCEFGLKSARVAELMQRAGYEAYSFLGGVKGLRGLAARNRDAAAAAVASSPGVDVD